jgi:hypothetical protein
MKQADAVAEAMRRFGGYATLGALFDVAPKVEGATFGGKTPNATIRKIVQIDDRFFRIRPGLWALKEYKNRIPFIEDALAPPKSPRAEEFTHGYYQGILVHIGNLRMMQTYVPPQDKNKKFLGSPLSGITQLERILPFGYDMFVDRAKTVDVIWFNSRNMPASFMEVEHSTDMQNSLLKFYDLQDFHAEFKIVAPANRERDFQSKIARGAFRELKDRVDFVTYEDAVTLYETLSKQATLLSRL